MNTVHVTLGRSALRLTAFLASVFSLIALCARGAYAGDATDISGAPSTESQSSLLSDGSFVRALELDNTAPATDAPRFSLEGAFFYGPVKGYVQTPAGGSPGSTSHRRP